MAINTETDIHLALVQLGKNGNQYKLDSNPPPHKITWWNPENKDLQPSDDELNTAYTAWKTAEEYKIKRTQTGSTTYDTIGNQLDMLYADMLAGKLDTTGTWATHIKAVKDANPKPS